MLTWLPVLVVPDTEKDCGVSLVLSGQAVYWMPQKFLSILTQML